jgi:hypothetical protein
LVGKEDGTHAALTNLLLNKILPDLRARPNGHDYLPPPQAFSIRQIESHPSSITKLQQGRKIAHFWARLHALAAHQDADCDFYHYGSICLTGIVGMTDHTGILERMMNTLDTNSLRLHVPVLGWLYVVANAVLLIIGLVALALFWGIGIAVQDLVAYRILTLVGGLALALFALFALPGLIAGVGLLQRRRWARTLALVVGILGLAAFPIGTALGIYAFFVLLQAQADEYFGAQSEDS